jgi:hypothetical protein
MTYQFLDATPSSSSRTTSFSLKITYLNSAPWSWSRTKLPLCQASTRPSKSGGQSSTSVLNLSNITETLDPVLRKVLSQANSSRRKTKNTFKDWRVELVKRTTTCLLRRTRAMTVKMMRETRIKISNVKWLVITNCS